MKAKLMGLLKDEEGQGMVEYGLIVGAIAVIAVTLFVVLGPNIKALFDNIFPTPA